MKNSEAFSDVTPEKWKPEQYQVKAMKWLLSHGGAGLFLDPGLGKTSTVLASLKVLKNEGQLKKGALIVAPLRPLYNVWDAENPDSEPHKWIDFHSLKIVRLHGDDKDRRVKEKADIYLVNPDGLPWLFRHKRGDDFDVLVIDESTTFKHSNTMRFKLLRMHLNLFRRRWILTGSPSANSLMDLFGQIYILDLGNALGRFITHYRRTFFNPTGYGGYTWVPQDGAEERIYKRIEPLVIRMDEKDYLKLPPLIGAIHGDKPNIVKVQLPQGAEKKYKEMEELFFTELEEGSVTAANAGVKSIKLRQIAQGGVYIDKGAEETGGIRARDQRRWNLVHEAKTDAVVELLDDLEGKAVVIAYEFHHDVIRMRMNKRLANVPAIGEGSLKDDVLLAQRWNRGDLQYLFVNPASFSRGSNMQRGGDALIFHSPTYNFEHYDQLIRRFWRKGRRKPFHVFHVFAENTVDAAALYALNRKNKTQRGLLDALRAYSLRRPRA